MAKDIATLRASLTMRLNALAQVYGETTVLTLAQQNVISYEVDAVNETWNENLPPRPKS
jgi:hypothetical protein